ncbi:putative membrane protein [Pseudomonas nitritireducens]|uniref:Putative membrane protein n=1 Tax=Pseudomonas nitroreducens TaxID=46680 RepID=A0A7W7KLN4_PSENT|nr:putative membrane protein [Pseudomonas nitritireducens]
MNPGTFVTLMILGWVVLALVTLWAILRVPLRRARLQKAKPKSRSSRHHPIAH